MNKAKAFNKQFINVQLQNKFLFVQNLKITNVIDGTINLCNLVVF